MGVRAGLEDPEGVAAVQDGAHGRLPCEEEIIVQGLKLSLPAACMTASWFPLFMSSDPLVALVL
jgi:hypothetical protein